MSKPKAAPATIEPTDGQTAGEIAFDKVVALLKERSLAEQGACAAAGCAASTLSQARGSGRTLGLAVIEKFAAFLDVPIGWLIGETLPPKAKEDPSMRRISLRDICQSPLNPRKTFNPTEIAELADSIAEQGLLQNLVVRKTSVLNLCHFQIVAGERRFRAIQLLEDQKRLPPSLHSGIPCRVIDGDDGDHIVIAILENMQRKDVNAMEEAEAIAKLQTIDPVKYSCPNLGRLTGKSERHYQLRLQLVKDLAPETQTALRVGKITLAQARVLTMADRSIQKNMLTNGFLKDATAAQVRSVVTRDWVPLDLCRFDTTKPDLQHLITLDGESGKSFFMDKKRFKELNHEAANVMLAEAAKTFAWTERTDWFPRHEFEEHQASPPELGGYLLVITWEGNITVHSGLVRKKPKAAGSNLDIKEEIRHRQISADLRKERQIDAEQFRRSIAGVIRSRDAIRILLMTAVSVGPINCYSLDEGVPTLLVTEGALRPIAPMLTDNEGLAVTVDNQNIGELWDALSEIDDAGLGESLASMIAAQLDVSPNDVVHPILVKIAEREGIGIPPLLLLGYNEILAEIDRRTAEPDPQTDIEDAIAQRGEAA